MTACAVITNEKRKFARYETQFPASIRLKDGMRYNGTMENISSNGAYFGYKDIAQFRNETSCILSIFIEGKYYSEEIEIDCTLKPRASGGAGLEFKTMSTRDYINFVFLLSKAIPEQDKLLADLKNNPGIELLD